MITRSPKRFRAAQGHLALGRLGLSRSRSIGIIGGADGPTKIYVASRRPHWGRGRIQVRPALDAVLASLRLVSTYFLILSVILAACNHLLTATAEKNGQR